MNSKAVVIVGLLALFACALAQNQNADDARALGEPGNNYCKALCDEAPKRNKAYEKLVDFCNKTCEQCVKDIQGTTQGKKEPLPASCKTAYNFKEIPQIIGEFQQGKLQATKSG